MLDDSYCLIIPDRGDRSIFTNLLKERLKGFNIIHVNYPPKHSGFDLVERVREGVSQAKAKGYEKAFIVENDDYYPLDYFQPFEEDFVGYSDTIYYHLKNRTWEKTFHNTHSSLFTTAFKLSALDDMRWPRPDQTFLDIHLWKYALKSNLKVKLKPFNPCIGIKHGIGLCGGMGHKQVFPFKDYDLKWLQSKVDERSFETYKQISSNLIHPTFA